MLKCDSFREKAMNDLSDCTGEMVYVNYVTRGIPSLAVGEMNYILRFDFIIVRTVGTVKRHSKIIAGISPVKIPFIGEGIAIQKINIEGKKYDRVVYDNFFIKDDYRLADPVRVSELKDLIFGNFKSG